MTNFIQFCNGQTFISWKVCYIPSLFGAKELWVHEMGTPDASIIQSKPVAMFKVKDKERKAFPGIKIEPINYIHGSSTVFN
jgi:hypothetical protein